MTVNDTDKFLVNRSNTSYQIETQNLMAELQDTDLMLVNRGGVSYKATGAEIKDSVGSEAIITPVLITPANGATGVNSANLTLTGSLFISKNGTHTSTDWQITTDADTGFTTPFFDIVDDTTNLTAYPTVGIMQPGFSYRARVRYKDTVNNLTSDWSDPSVFSTRVPFGGSDFVKPGIAYWNTTQTADGPFEATATRYAETPTGDPIVMVGGRNIAIDSAGAVWFYEGGVTATPSLVTSFSSPPVAIGQASWNEYYAYLFYLQDGSLVHFSCSTQKAVYVTPTTWPTSEIVSMTSGGLNTVDLGFVRLNPKTGVYEGWRGCSGNYNVALPQTEWSRLAACDGCTSVHIAGLTYQNGYYGLLPDGSMTGYATYPGPFRKIVKWGGVNASNQCVVAIRMDGRMSIVTGGNWGIKDIPLPVGELAVDALVPSEWRANTPTGYVGRVCVLCQSGKVYMTKNNGGIGDFVQSDWIELTDMPPGRITSFGGLCNVGEFSSGSSTVFIAPIV